MRELVTALVRARIEYCVVGGLAVNLHGVSRQTHNVDLVVRPDRPTLTALEALLAELGLSSRAGIALHELGTESRRRRLLVQQNLVSVAFVDPRDALRQVHVVVAPPLAPAQLVERSVARNFEGLSVRVAALSDLMFIKRVSGWQGDADDVARLERARRKPRSLGRSRRPPRKNVES